MPRDPHDTLRSVAGGTLDVGVSANSPWTGFEGERPTGIEVLLVEDLARRLGTRVRWHRGAESALIERLGRGELQLVIGGLTDDSPWSDEVGLSQPHTIRDGVEYVMAVRQGENAWLLTLDRFLLDNPNRELATAGQSSEP